MPPPGYHAAVRSAPRPVGRLLLGLLLAPLVVGLPLVAGAAAARAGEAAPLEERAKALAAEAGALETRFHELEKRVRDLEAAMDEEERQDPDADRPRPRRPARTPAEEKPTEPEAPSSEPKPAEGSPDAEPEGEKPEGEAPPAVPVVVGVYDLDTELSGQAMEAVMRKQMADEDMDLPPNVLDEIFDQFKERLKTFTFELTVAEDGTWHAAGTMDEGEEQSARGTWTDKGDGAYEFLQTEENGEKPDEPQTLHATYEDGVLRLEMPNELLPFSLVLRKRA